jgi:hypothetical protein
MPPAVFLMSIVYNEATQSTVNYERALGDVLRSAKKFRNFWGRNIRTVWETKQGMPW